MSNTPTLVLSVVLASTAAAGVSWWMRPSTAVPPADTGTEVQRELADLRALVATLKTQLEQVRSAPVPATSLAQPERVAAAPTDEQVAAAVSRFDLALD